MKLRNILAAGQSLEKTLQNVMVSKTGPLTRELLLSPSDFGLGRVPANTVPDATTTAVCGFCSTGCGLNVHLKDGQAVGLTPSTDYAVNLGMACPKGWEALSVLDSADRATTPLLRDAHGKLIPASWDIALETFVRSVKDIQSKYGADSFAFLSTGQTTTEEMAYLGALTKFGMGMLHGDGNTRQCMATAVVAYKQAFGFDAPPYTYKDFEESDVIVLVGSNLCVAHPIMWERVCKNPHSPEIITVDPRCTETAVAGTMHLPLKPKSDQILFYGVAKLLIDKGWIERSFIDTSTTGFDEFRDQVQRYDLTTVSMETGLAKRQIERFAEVIHEGKRVSFWWTMGVNQSHQGVRTAQSIINLALMTGNIGKPGTGANSITGQCNAMGSRLFSNTTNLLGGHDFSSPEDRQKVANVLNLDSACIPEQPSMAYDQILEAVLAKKIRGLWIIATNGAHSWINQNSFRDIVSRLDFLVVQDMYSTTETASLADLVLPAAGWGEKDGTFINSERRIGVVKKVRKAPGQALSDFNIFRLVANYYGCSEVLKEWTTPEKVFASLSELSKGQPCDFSAVKSYRQIDDAGGIQWPCPHLRVASERRLFENGEFFHNDKKARFIFEESRPITEPPTDEFPFLLLTGRGSASQWHTQTRTNKSAVLRKLHPSTIYLEMNPRDAELLGIAPQSKVAVRSQRGSLVAHAVLTHSVQRGQVFLPMHYEETNRLTDAVFDPYSRQPSYKACAVSVDVDKHHS